ncbi:hypothetical protein COV39_02075 [Candidatus Berkelbacteria bacterium CG11_big_fil_rev_8_21_14_0_20_40_23]|nr:MAG: hypothetical protein COV39_02075 [Candidatus Berkelbacteria bacterium CG11_big_fil_rev_8_21_14_0_20_40_23]
MGWVGQGQHLLWWRILQSKIRNSAASEKSDSAKGGQAPSEGGQKFLVGMALQPPSFLPARAIGF